MSQLVAFLPHDCPLMEFTMEPGAVMEPWLIRVSLEGRNSRLKFEIVVRLLLIGLVSTASGLVVLTLFAALNCKTLVVVFGVLRI